MVRNINWKTIKDDGPPPFDTLCIVYGTRKEKDYQGVEYEYPGYCLAYNQNYRPQMWMCQVFCLPFDHSITRVDVNNYTKNPAILVDVPFEIEKWCEIDE